MESSFRRPGHALRRPKTAFVQRTEVLPVHAAKGMADKDPEGYIHK